MHGEQNINLKSLIEKHTGKFSLTTFTLSLSVHKGFKVITAHWIDSKLEFESVVLGYIDEDVNFTFVRYKSSSNWALDSLAWSKANEGLFENLYRHAQYVLATRASSTASKSTFSQVRLLFDKRNIRLSDESTTAFVFFKS